ncbi:MAG: Xaa-Pro peptidase family protein [Candidatus Bipolaricaulis sp.]|nr:Xaa-Pro peptidase family protein [Candidatus Bipolaricaulis sp.]
MLNKGIGRTFYRTPTFAEFPKSEYEARVKKAYDLMKAEEIDALLLWDEENIRYFTGFNSTHWRSKSIQPAVAILVQGQAPVLVVPEFFRGVSEATTYVDDIRGQERFDHIPNLRALPREVAAVLSEMSCATKRIGIEDGDVANMYIPRPVRDIDTLRAALPKATFVGAAHIIWACRVIKSDLEVDAIRRAWALTAEAFAEFVERFELGMSEREAGALLYAAIVRRGLTMGGMYFVGDPSRYPMIDSHPSFEGVPMRRGSHVVVECGGVYKGYHGSVGRCLEIGPISDEKLEFIEAVEAGQDGALASLRHGVKAQDVIAAAAAALAKKGFKPTGFVGHSIGLTGHEPPDLTDTQTMLVQKGMVLAVEVWIYEITGFTRGGRLTAEASASRKNLGQFGMEEVVLVTDDGYEMLPAFPREIRMIPRSLGNA